MALSMAKSNPSKANKRSRSQREADRAVIARLRLKGLTQREIMEALNAQRPYKLSRQQIAADLSKLESEWRKEANRNIRILKATAYARLRYTMRNLWDAWKESKTDLERRKVEEFTNERTGETFTKRTITTTSRYGDVSIMWQILEVQRSICELFGLYGQDQHDR